MSDLATTPRTERREAVRYLHAFRQHWLLIAALVAVAVGAAFIYVSTTPKEYESAVDVVVTPVAANDETFQGLSLFRQSVDASSSVVTAARVFNSSEIRSPVYDKLGDAGRDVSFDIQPLSQADIVTVTATAPDAELATQAANMFADTAVAERTALFQRELASAHRPPRAAAAGGAARNGARATSSTRRSRSASASSRVSSAPRTRRCGSSRARPSRRGRRGLGRG